MWGKCWAVGIMGLFAWPNTGEVVGVVVIVAVLVVYWNGLGCVCVCVSLSVSVFPHFDGLYICIVIYIFL